MMTMEVLERAIAELPKKVLQAEIAVIELEDRLLATERQLKIHRAKVLSSIVNERTDAGKARFSSEDARSAELELRLSEDREYNELAVHYRELELEARKAQAELRHQHARMKVAEMLVQLVTAKTK